MYYIMMFYLFFFFFFFFQAEDGIRDIGVTGVQTCALPILHALGAALYRAGRYEEAVERLRESDEVGWFGPVNWLVLALAHHRLGQPDEIGRASCRERV